MVVGEHSGHVRAVKVELIDNADKEVLGEKVLFGEKVDECFFCDKVGEQGVEVDFLVGVGVVECGEVFEEKAFGLIVFEIFYLFC